MLQLRCHGSVSAWLLLRLFGHRNRGLSVGRFGLLRLEDLPEPVLPAPDWVRVRPRWRGFAARTWACSRRGAVRISRV